MRRVAEKIVFQSKIFTIKEVVVEADSGDRRTIQILEKGDSSLIVPVLDNGNVLFVREYFYAIDKYQLGLPKGRIEKGDGGLETASRELQEEIGHKAGKLDKLATLTMSPGYLTQRTHVFLARELSKSKLRGDELEELQVLEYPLEKFEDLIQKGELTEARMIAALFLARKVFGGKVGANSKLRLPS